VSLIEVLVLQGYRLSDFLVAVVPREQSIIYVSLHDRFPLEGGGCTHICKLCGYRSL